jgi:transposase
VPTVPETAESAPKSRRRRRGGPLRPHIEALLEKYPDITAQRVFEILREEDSYTGGDTIVKALVRKLRKHTPPKPSLATPPREPGDLAECDWSPFPVSFTHAPSMTLQVFGYVLRYSTRKFYSFHESTDIHALMDGHLHAFARFGAVARRCKYDNQKPVVLRWEGNQPIYNLRFVDFAAYYEFEVVACRPRSPNDKPRVERAFYELMLSFFRGRSFRDRDDLAAQLTHWMDAIADKRPIKRMRKQSRMELFAEEAPLMRPLPRHPFDTARVMYRLCDLEGFIAWEGNWYSLPYEHVTDLLPVRVTERELFVYDAALNCIARHALLPRGAQKRSIIAGHRPPLADRGPGLDQLRAAFASLGAPAAEFLAALEQQEPRSAGYHARLVLALRTGYDTSSLLDAMQHALAYGALRHESVERILLARAPRRRLDDYIKSATPGGNHGEHPDADLSVYDALPVGSANAHNKGDTACQNPNNDQVPPPSFENGSLHTSSASD